MGGQDFARPFSDALVRIVLKFIEHANDATLIDRRRPVAEHVKNPTANLWIGIVGHLEESIPNLRVVDLNFARTQSPNRLEPRFGVAVSAQFEQARNF